MELLGNWRQLEKERKVRPTSRDQRILEKLGSRMDYSACSSRRGRPRVASRVFSVGQQEAGEIENKWKEYLGTWEMGASG